MAERVSIGRLILWPSVITLLITAVRLIGEWQGWINRQSGGAGALLGIVWLVFVFGAWFGIRLSRSGSLPRPRRAWPYAALLLLALFGVAAWQFGPIASAGAEVTFERLRAAVLAIMVFAVPIALVTFFLWPRLAMTMAIYGLIARAGVVAATAVAKAAGWDTHYTKFGPSGLEREFTDTIASAAIAQFGLWVPVTIVGGVFVGTLFARGKR